MTALYNSIKIPDDLLIGSVASFSMTVIAGILTNNPLRTALLRGTIGATITAAEVITRPFVRSVFSNCPTIHKAIQILAPQAIASYFSGVPSADKISHLSWGIFSVCFNLENYSKNYSALVIVPSPFPQTVWPSFMYH